MTERNLFVLHALQLLLGLAAAQPLFWGVSVRCWKLFLAVSALCHLYKASNALCPAYRCATFWLSKGRQLLFAGVSMHCWEPSVALSAKCRL